MINRITTVLLLWLLAGAGSGLMAQQGFGTSAPHASSVVEMKSDNKGVLFPRVNLKGTDDTETVPGAADHLLVFNLVAAGSGATRVTPGFYFHESTGWVRLLVPDDVLSWDVTGNSGVKDGSFLGTTDATDLVMKTNNIERMRIKAGGAVGVHTNAPDASAVMDLSSTTQGFLLPRMTTTEMSAIANPVDGLLVYNTDLKSPMYYVKDNGVYYSTTANPTVSSKPAALGSTYTNFYNGVNYGTYSGTGTTIRQPFGEIFSANATCANKLISAGGCGGAVMVRGVSGTVYPLVEINGQCWATKESREVPTNFPIAPVWTIYIDNGSWGYFNTIDSEGGGWFTTPATANEGLLYEWSSAMNGNLTERARGVCPVGFHVPSDCEWMYLEHGLGMSHSDQILMSNGGRGDGNEAVGFKLANANGNISGFSGAFLGARSIRFEGRALNSYWWSSSAGTDADKAYARFIYNDGSQVARSYSTRGFSFSVRCLKD